MNVLVLHSRYSTGPSSGENRVVDDEVALLRAHGHEVRLWSPDPPADTAYERAALGARAVWSRASVAHVRTLAAELRPDVIHVHNLYPMLSPAVLRTAAAPVVMTLHNYRLMCLPATFLRDGRTCEDCLGHGPWRGVVHRCYRGSAAGSASLATALALHRRAGTFRRVTRFLAVSEFVRTKHIEAGIEPDRIAVKPNFVDPLPRRQGPGEYFLFLGRLAPEKGVGPLIEAWREIPARLVVVGDGEERARLAATAPSTVEFHDAVPGDQVGPYLARARALVVPSIWYEGAPRTITEAYAAGVPVIAIALRGAARRRPGRRHRGAGRAGRPHVVARSRRPPAGRCDRGRARGPRLCRVAYELQSGARDRGSGRRLPRSDGSRFGREHVHGTWATGRNRRTARLTRCHNASISVEDVPSRGRAAAVPGDNA